MNKIILSLVLILLISIGCDNDFEELNTNPLAPSEVNSGAIYNELVSSLRLGWNRQLFLHNEVLYDVTEQAVVTAKTFGNVDGGAEDVWSNYYTALKNARELERRYESLLEDPRSADIVSSQLKVLMAYKTFQVTDLFGDIPYSEAGSAFLDEPILRAKYDDQADIYESLIENLLAASKVFSGQSEPPIGPYLRYGSFETLFNDNLDKWKRFTNSLALRHLVRMYEVNPEFVTPIIKEFSESSTDFITDGNDAVMSPRQQAWTNEGVNWSFREHNKVRMGSTFWNFMTDGTGAILDPRLKIFCEENNEGDWQAFPQNPMPDTPQSGGEPYQKDKRDGTYENKGADNIYSSFNFYLIRDEQDIPEILMTSAEVNFLWAEIFLRGIGVNPDPFIASGRYNNGIISSFKFWNDIVEDSEIWVNKPPINVFVDAGVLSQHPKYLMTFDGDNEENRRRIYEQRWVDSFRQPWEAFALLRRTNMVPREREANEFFRFLYPQSEVTFNSENYNAQATSMGGDRTDVKLWWMGN